MSRNTVKGYLFAILSAVIYGCMPLMATLIYADGVNPFTLVFLRNLFSLIPLALLACREKRTLKVSMKLLPSLSLISVLGCSLTPILLFSSYRYMASGTATVFHFAYPAIVVLGNILFCRKRAQFGNIFSVLLCAVGINLFYTPGQPISLTGSALALSSAVTFAAYVVLLSHFNNREASGFLFSFYVALVSSIVPLIICLVTNSLMLPATAWGWGLCILFSLMVTTGAVVLFQQSTFLIGGERASILSTLEPITSIIIGVIVFQEPLGFRTLLGVIFVVSASILTALFDIKYNKTKA